MPVCPVKRAVRKNAARVRIGKIRPAAAGEKPVFPDDTAAFIDHKAASVLCVCARAHRGNLQRLQVPSLACTFQILVRKNRFERLRIPRVRARHVQKQIVGQRIQRVPVRRSAEQPVDQHRRIRARQNRHVGHACRKHRIRQIQRARERSLQLIGKRGILGSEIGRLRFFLRCIRVFRAHLIQLSCCFRLRLRNRLRNFKKSCRRADCAVIPRLRRNVRKAAFRQILRGKRRQIADQLRCLCTPERLIGSKNALWRAHIRRVLQVFRLDLRSKSPGSDRLRLRLLLLLRHALRASAKQQRQRQNAAADV